MIRILLIAAAVSLGLSFVSGDYLETLGILLAVFFATTVGFYFERDAARKFDVLTALGEEQPVKVLRRLTPNPSSTDEVNAKGEGSSSKVMEIARHEVVVGDVVLVETGDEVPADGTLFEATALEVDESSLTGEAMATKESLTPNPSPKGEGNEMTGAYPKDMLLRSSMVMSGTGRYVVTAVGDETEIGHVAREATELTGVKTPLNLQLDRLAKLISKVGTGVSLLAFVAFLLRDVLVNPLWHTTDYVGMAEVVLRYFMMAVTLIVMAVPEGLPMAVTLALALNMRRMLKSNNLVRRLHASETMGAVDVICTDKTGTLTQNRMTVSDVRCKMEDGRCEMEDGRCSALGPQTSDLYKAIALNTTATHEVGNPTEQALLRWLMEQGMDYDAIRRDNKIDARLPFSTERKFMATLSDGTLYVKGAPERVLDACDMTADERKGFDEQLRQWQQHAMRTLAFAQCTMHNAQCAMDNDENIEHLQLQAICAISDPLRPEVPQAVADCQRAGIEVKIVTGDTEATALEIARQIGLVSGDEHGVNDEKQGISGESFSGLSDEDALCRVSNIKVMYRARPRDKQRLVELLQRQGRVVAVTGDGTNDAPALNRAQVGLSLGSGTSVAKQASDITLIDDSFRSIVQAVMWGRSLYRNIQRFIFFQLVVNVVALLLVLCGSAIGTELPLTVTQILWVNLIMDTFAAMALASLPPSREVMAQPPRHQTDFIITPGMARGIISVGVLFFAVMFAMLWHIERSDGGISVEELTVFFTTFVMLQWWNLFNARALGSRHSAFRYLHRARGLLLVLAMILLGQWLIVTFGGRMFRTVPLAATTWLTIFAATSPVLIVGELYRRLRK